MKLGNKNVVLRNIGTLVTMTDGPAIQSGVDLRIEGALIKKIGPNLPVQEGDRVLDASNWVVYPGFINTHHHLYQTLTRNLPKVQNAKLFDWLVDLYEVWRWLGPEAVDVSTRVGVGELLLSGCTTTTDHLYLVPEGAPAEWIDIEIKAAAEMGIRFHPTRGSMSVGRTKGGLPPDCVTQTEEAILEDSQRIISTWHDSSPHSMCRIHLAPCSPFSVSPELMKKTAMLARQFEKVGLHTHLCETMDEEQYCIDTFGRRPLDFMADCDWLGEDVWYAHGIYFNDDELKRLAETKTGIAHCPASNLRLGSGIARIPEMLDLGVPVGLAVDGSASNDASNMLREMQLALLVHRIGTGVDRMPPSSVLHIATRGGAEVLGQPELGQLAVGAPADLCAFRLDRIEYAGALHDPASAVLFCGGAPRAELTVVNGVIRVEHGELVDVDEDDLCTRQNALASDLVRAAEEHCGMSYRG